MTHRSCSLFIIWLFCLSLPYTFAQSSNSNSETEVYLSFRYEGVIDSYVSAYYKDDKFYLPVGELFALLKIDHQIDNRGLTISGTYLGKEKYVLNFDNSKLYGRHGTNEIRFHANDVLVKQTDYYIRPAILQQLFGLKFTVHFNRLDLKLETDDKMPAVIFYERERRRSQINPRELQIEKSYYPLQYDREYNLLNGGFIDYNFSTFFSRQAQLLAFNNTFGAEVLHGDLQGSILGNLSTHHSSFSTQSLRWRYVKDFDPYFNSATIGQTVSRGFGNRMITGFKISNRPIEPRKLFDRYTITGTVEPQSEVELFLNNRLVDFQETDETGNYHFAVPLMYGNTDYSVQAYTPSGRSIERNFHLQVPFDYVPPGEIDYSVSGGRLNNPILGYQKRGYMGEATVATGINNQVTARASMEYLTNYHGSFPALTATVNSRLFSNYLISFNANTENFYRLSNNVVYDNGTSWGLNYDFNPGKSKLYNISGSDHRGTLNIFAPLQIEQYPVNLRLLSTYQKKGAQHELRYRGYINTRIKRLNIRFSYEDQHIWSLYGNTASTNRISNSYSYTLGQHRTIPEQLRGTYLRGQISYLPNINSLEEFRFQISRSIRNTSRLQFSFSRNFLAGFNTLSLNISLDLNKFWSNTTSEVSNYGPTFTQSVRGSVGYNPVADHLMLYNRHQVGQSGTAIRLFVDKNDDGIYQPDKDQLINDPAVRVKQGGSNTETYNGINYIHKLQPYRRYNLEVKKEQLDNPLLVPKVENFSIVTDPNQYKPIEIPFYLTGVISGRVERTQDGVTEVQSGIRLYLESTDENIDYKKELRTFSDGSFYAYEIPPGEYELYIDSNQLSFLNGTVEPERMHVEVEAKSGGDFVENLNFLIISTGTNSD